ncbi:hypothetical protein NQ318_011195 [Aromia moschata]|uniref:DDE-1 domain-containing protein n=1 Tax=Aromia moschata TaxID=1265417 RepID=A0AAV8X1T8_9CUCU|nr:hypothetical protein NQ318_011195 [Aromia moschata]
MITLFKSLLQMVNVRKFWVIRNKNISMRTPQGVSAARIKRFTKENVKQFYDILEPELNKINFNPSRVYNVDETGITAVQHKHTKIIGLKAELMDGAPPGSIGKCHPSGWIQSHIFKEWIDHFIKHSKPSREDPIILSLDGHYTHTRNLDVINKARENHITLICLPPHSTHKLQPLDVALMAPLKTYYCQEIENWLKSNPGRTVSPYQIASLLGKAYVRAASLEISINGFRKCGIIPFNRDIFRDHDFAIHEKLETSLQDDGTKKEIPLETDSEKQITDTPADKSKPHIVILQNVLIQQNAKTSIVENKSDFVKPGDLNPLPSLPGPSGIKRKNSGSAALVSGSPYKTALEESQSPKITKTLKEK